MARNEEEEEARVSVRRGSKCHHLPCAGSGREASHPSPQGRKTPRLGPEVLRTAFLTFDHLLTGVKTVLECAVPFSSFEL